MARIRPRRMGNYQSTLNTPYVAGEGHLFRADTPPVDRGSRKGAIGEGHQRSRPAQASEPVKAMSQTKCIRCRMSIHAGAWMVKAELGALVGFAHPSCTR